MPRRYLTPAEARNLRIMGQGEQIQRDDRNGEDFIVYTSSEDDYSDSEEDLGGNQMTAADLLLAQPQMTEDERVDAILNGELVGINLQNLTQRESQALETFIDDLAVERGIIRPEMPRTRQAHFCECQPEQAQAQAQELVAVPMQPPPQPNLLQVQPEEIDQELLELAFSESPEVDVNALMQILGAPGDPGDPNTGSTVNQCNEDEPDMRHFVIQGGRKRRKRRTRKTRKSRKSVKKNKSKRKSKRKTKKRKSIK